MCNKKPYNKKWEAVFTLKHIIKRACKTPWRDEVSVYKCNECDKFHISFICEQGNYVPQKIKKQDYFEYQKEKWGGWLHNFASNGAVINKLNKKYST
jgi:hypothetical protein